MTSKESTRKSKFTRGRKVMGLAALVLLGLVVGFVIAEMGARVYVSSAPGLAPGEFREPGVFATAEYSIRIRVVEGGFRHPCEKNKPTKDLGYKLAVIGDSFAYGSGVEECETFSSVISSERSWLQVTNYGRPGVGFNEALQVANERVCGAGYDGVLLLVFGNDFLVFPGPVHEPGQGLALVGMVQRALDPPDGRLKAPAPRIEGVDPDLLDLGEKFEEDPFYFPIVLDLLRNRDTFAHISDPPPGLRVPNLEVFEELMKSIHRCSDDVWVAVVPNGALVDDRQRRYIEAHHGTVPGSQVPSWVYETVRTRATETRSTFVETFDAFLHSPDRNYYESDPHWTAIGHRLFAELMLDVLPTAP